MSRSARKAGGRELTVTIAEMGARGDGLSNLEDGTPLFVPHALPGEVVRIRTASKTDAGMRGDVIELISASAERNEPTCNNSPRCGGCVFQNWNLQAQTKWKLEQVKSAVKRSGFDVSSVQPLISPTEAGRRRARFASHRNVIGFRERRSHDIISQGPCMTLGPELISFWQMIQNHPLLKTTGDWTVTHTPAGFDVSITSKANPPDPLTIERLPLGPEKIIRLSWNGDVLIELEAPRVNLGGLEPVLPPGGFLQPSIGGQKTLQDLVLKAIPNEVDWVADLFCGLGTFSIPLAQRGHRVQAIEAHEASIAALDAAVRRDPSNKYKIHVGLRNLDLYPMLEQELNGFGAVVFDPPRAGARSQSRRLAESSVPCIVGVSCNPTTWSRDAKLLKEGGFHLSRVTPVDQFPNTPHLELVSVFVRS